MNPIERDIDSSLQQAKHMKMTMDFIFDKLFAPTAASPDSEPSRPETNKEKVGDHNE